MFRFNTKRTDVSAVFSFNQSCIRAVSTWSLPMPVPSCTFPTEVVVLLLWLMLMSFLFFCSELKAKSTSIIDTKASCSLAFNRRRRWSFFCFFALRADPLTPFTAVLICFCFTPARFFDTLALMRFVFCQFTVLPVFTVLFLVPADGVKRRNEERKNTHGDGMVGFGETRWGA